jgi:EmrB/QacA subfamily drug resistance transporter
MQQTSSPTLEPGEQPIGLRSLPRKQVIITMVGISLAMFLGSLDQTIVATAMPRIVASLGGFAEYTWVTTAYILASTVTIPIVGKLNDMYGRKPFYLAGLIIFAIGSLFCGLSQSMTQIIFARGFQGIGAGMMMANAFTVIGDLFPPAERGKYQGIISALYGVSSIVGPTLGGALSDGPGWHWVFFINLPFTLIIILLFVFFFPHFKPDDRKHKVDWAGLSLLVLAVSPLLLALNWAGSEYPWGSPVIIGMLAFSAACIALLLWVEDRAEEPIFPLCIFRNRIVWVSMAVIFFSAFGMFAGIIFVPLYFQAVLGASASTSGNLLIPMMLGMVVGSALAGVLMSRWGRYRILSLIGLGIMAVGLFLMARMDPQTSYGLAIALIVTTGLGLGMTMPIYSIVVQNAIPYNFLGAATSATAFFRSIGGAVGLSIFGSLMANRFVSELVSHIPPTVQKLLPGNFLESLTQNAGALFGPQAMDGVAKMFGNLGPGGAEIARQITGFFREAISSALNEVFLLAAIMVAVSFVLSFFLREIPLRKRQVVMKPQAGDNKSCTL